MSNNQFINTPNFNDIIKIIGIISEASTLMPKHVYKYSIATIIQQECENQLIEYVNRSLKESGFSSTLKKLNQASKSKLNNNNLLTIHDGVLEERENGNVRAAVQTEAGPRFIEGKYKEKVDAEDPQVSSSIDVSNNNLNTNSQWTNEKNEKRIELIKLKHSGVINSSQVFELEMLTNELRAYRNLHAPLPIKEELELNNRLKQQLKEKFVKES